MYSAILSLTTTSSIAYFKKSEISATSIYPLRNVLAIMVTYLTDEIDGNTLFGWGLSSFQKEGRLLGIWCSFVPLVGLVLRT